MLLTRTGCEPPREVATGQVRNVTRAAVDVGFHLARREEFIKARVAASSMCRARFGLITGRSSEPRQWGAHFASPSEITRRTDVRGKCWSFKISPNIKELPAAVQPFLQGFYASGRRIQQLGDAEEFKRRRRPRGKTVASERRKK
jgi:hypothetical protein